MDYCIKTWDPREQGVIEEPHHNTYDIEFWGPDGMHRSFYDRCIECNDCYGQFIRKMLTNTRKLADDWKKMIETKLYDGEYFIQKIKVDGLNAKNPTTAKSFGGEYSKEATDLLEKEGPKYQYGNGCLSDGVLGAWIARMCGLNDSIDSAKIKSHLLCGVQI